MTPREVMLAQIRHEETRPVPYDLSWEGDVGERMDAHYGSTQWRSQLTSYVAYLPGVQILRFDPAEDGFSRDPFGGRWRSDRRPFHLIQPPLSEPSFDGYDLPGPEAFLLPGLKESMLEAQANAGDRFTMIGMGWGLFEASWGLRGFEGAMMDAVADPDFYDEMMERLTDNYLAFVEFVREVPVDAIRFGDDWGDQRGVILGPERWRKFMKDRYARIYEAAHAQGKIVITHCCGSVVDIIPDLIDIGLDVLESCQPEAAGMNPYELKRQWGDQLTFWGCLGSQSTVPFGTPAQISAEIAHLCAEMGSGGGYILAPAKPLQPETPTENAVAVFEAFTQQG